MADDWLNIALRFGLYIGMSTLFGVSMFGVYAQRLSANFTSFGRRFTTFLLFVASADIILSLLSMVVTAKAMSGAETYGELTAHILGMVITGTDMGIAWIARMLGLITCIAIIFSGLRFNIRFILLTAFSGMALATLAWSGHAAMNDGVKGTVHLVSGISHLWAAGAWIGALFSLAMLALLDPQSNSDAIGVLSKTSSGFARLGTVIVVSLIATGSINYFLIAGLSITPLISTQYGLLLSIKLSLFIGMLVFAAANRYLLSPKVELAITAGNGLEASRLLRRSLVMETTLAILVVVCVAWLGVLSPVVSKAN